MKRENPSLTKIKVTATMDPDLVQAIDEYIKQIKSLSRSQLIEDVLRQWYLKQKQREMESQIEQYYLALSESEREEDRQWVQIAAQGAHQLWQD